MRTKRLNFSEDPLTEFYQALASQNSARLADLYVPRSDVFYIRSLLEGKFGRKFGLKEVEDLLLDEGLLPVEQSYRKYLQDEKTD
jgi:hypothetical protein